MQEILEAILAEQFDEIGGLAIPEQYRGVTVHTDDTDMFAGLPTREKDPRKSLHVEDVATRSSDPVKH